MSGKSISGAPGTLGWVRGRLLSTAASDPNVMQAWDSAVLGLSAEHKAGERRGARWGKRVSKRGTGRIQEAS